MAQENELPDGWSMTTIDRVLAALPPHVREKVLTLLSGMEDMMETSHELRRILEPYKIALKNDGFDAAFLSYALPYWVTQAMQQERPLKTDRPFRGFYDDADTDDLSRN